MSNFKKQFPAPTGPYKVHVKRGDKWSDYNNSRLQISVGRSNFEGDKFFAACEWCSNRFDKTTLIISDTLQRWNHLINSTSEDEAFYISQQEGKEWFERNAKSIKNIDNASITFWEDWRQHPNFEGSHKRIINLYNTRIDFRNSVDLTIKRFADRNPEVSKNPNMFYRNSLNFLLEEAAAFGVMNQVEDAVDIYPGQSIRDTIILLRDLQDYSNYAAADIDFTRNKAVLAC